MTRDPAPVIPPGYNIGSFPAMSIKETLMDRRIFIIIISVLLLLLAATVPAGTVKLPKTGQVKCYDAFGDEINCAGTTQDGEYQAGVPWPDPRFSEGNGPEADCITDHLTGLMWPKNADLAGSSTWSSAVNYANNLLLCGHPDWRLPNISELASLVNANESDIASWLMTRGFYNVRDYYWSSTTYYYTNIARAVDMLDGSIFNYSKSSANLSVWPVRSAQSGGTITLPRTGQVTSYRAGDDGDLETGSAWPSPRFTDIGNGTVSDDLTGLIWLKDSNCIRTEYPSSDNDLVTSDGSVYWQSALEFIAGMNNGTYSKCSAGHDNWRLPNERELGSLIDYSKFDPALSSGHPFVNIQPYYYWTSTTLPNNTYNTRTIHMSGGYTGSGNKEVHDFFVWPVREEQTSPDRDGDGVTDGPDNCPDIPNADQADTDSDSVGDACDNCRVVSNPDQTDDNSAEDDNTTLDGLQHYGDACDPDFNNDGLVTLQDYAIWRTYYRQDTTTAPAYVDLDNDGLVGLSDYAIWRKYYRGTPGP